MRDIDIDNYITYLALSIDNQIKGKLFIKYNQYDDILTVTITHNDTEQWKYTRKKFIETVTAKELPADRIAENILTKYAQAIIKNHLK